MNGTIKTNILTVLLIFLFASFSQAQQTSPKNISTEKQALIKEYFEVSGGRKSVNDILDAIYAELNNTRSMSLSATIERDADLTASQKADLQKNLPEEIARLNKKFRDELNKELDFAKFLEEVNFSSLDKYFTETELKDLIVFYKSPTGQKTISVLPKLITDASGKLNAVLIPAMQKVMQRTTNDEIDEMIKKAKQGN